MSCFFLSNRLRKDNLHFGLKASGGKARYEIPTGRFDGRESLASTVDLPGPQMSVSDTFKMFEKRKLSLTDMVLLLGMNYIP